MSNPGMFRDRSPVGITLTPNQAAVLRRVVATGTEGYGCNDGNEERTLRSLRRRGLVVKGRAASGVARWYKPEHAPRPEGNG